MSENLRQKTITGVFWTATERAGHFAFSIVTTILIARALKPEDYGLMGMLTVFLAVTGSFVDSGFGQALIRKKDATDTDYSTVFYFSIVVGLFFFVLLFFLAPLIARFYNEPGLVPVSRATFLLLIINATSQIHHVDLTRKIDFKTITKINLISAFVSGSIGIITAYCDFGVWALVYQLLSYAIARGLLLWYLSRWRPIFKFSKKSFLELFSFGSKLLISGILYQVTSNIYQLIIGKFYDSRSVGFYTQANRIQQIPASSISSVMQPVTYPALSKIQDEDTRLKQAFRKIMKQITLVNFPALLLLAIVAKPFIQVFLTEKWLPAAPLLSMLCIAGMLYPLHAVNLDILKVKGRSDLFLYLDILKSILVIGTLLFTTRFGVKIMVCGQVLLSFFCYFLNALVCGRLINYSIRQQLTDILPYFLTTISVGLFTLLLSFTRLADLRLLLSQVALFMILYLSAMRLFKFEAFNELQNILFDKLTL